MAVKRKSKKKSPAGKKRVGGAALIAFQGMPGAYSHLACRARFPEMTPLPCAQFEDAFAAVQTGKARLAMIPVDNSVAGRVADIHHILPRSGLYIIGEHFQPVHHHLLVTPGATLKSLKRVESHVHALGQCRKFLRKNRLTPIVAADTAGAAKDVSERKDVTVGAIASQLAAGIYGLKSLASNIEDAEHNTTRFLIMSRTPVKVDAKKGGPYITSFVFRVRSVPAALYKALGGFATNGVNMTKLESYMVGGHFEAAQFYADVDGHPDDRPLKLALEDLCFYSRELTILGTYPAHRYRLTSK
ncbi:MAG: prephenate dehydratase [Rhodospirillaceae bacterium]|nr:prephenate dehydratase [Rhodospirillaceae bacterium]